MGWTAAKFPISMCGRNLSDQIFTIFTKCIFLTRGNRVRFSSELHLNPKQNFIQFVCTFLTCQKSAVTHWRSWQSMQQRGRRRRDWPGSSCWCPSASCRGTRWRSPACWRRSPPGWWRSGAEPHTHRGRWTQGPPLEECWLRICLRDQLLHLLDSALTEQLGWRDCQA